jgi:hypothetical protein
MKVLLTIMRLLFCLVIILCIEIVEIDSIESHQIA